LQDQAIDAVNVAACIGWVARGTITEALKARKPALDTAD
jgi:hypothetical protein